MDPQDDPKWEFQAPQFVDFTNLDKEDEVSVNFSMFKTIQKIMAVDTDPNSFSLLDPDPLSICGSGSRREKLKGMVNNYKKARKLVTVPVIIVTKLVT